MFFHETLRLRFCSFEKFAHIYLYLVLFLSGIRFADIALLGLFSQGQYHWVFHKKTPNKQKTQNKFKLCNSKLVKICILLVFQQNWPCSALCPGQNYMFIFWRPLTHLSGLLLPKVSASQSQLGIMRQLFGEEIGEWIGITTEALCRKMQLFYQKQLILCSNKSKAGLYSFGGLKFYCLNTMTVFKQTYMEW